MVILRTEAQVKEFKEQKKEERNLKKFYKEEASRLDKDFSESKFSSLSQAQEYYNSIPSDIRKSMTYNPNKKHQEEISKYETLVNKLREEEKKYDNKGDEARKKGKDDSSYKEREKKQEKNIK